MKFVRKTQICRKCRRAVRASSQMLQDQAKSNVRAHEGSRPILEEIGLFFMEVGYEKRSKE